ncbi:MAG TPA: DEAD/DEAH box helicase, partial [Pyrinomonadaceae bacterium]|nr:DEAD/DEAH box helicase [Pyrinomonadaceae bacterium]
MNVFETHSKIVSDYSAYIQSFINIADSQIEEKVRQELGNGKLWPDPLLHFNPAFQMAGDVSTLAESGVLHEDAAKIFRGYSLYQHQLEAIRLGTKDRDFIVTSGTGSGKSLTYISTIFDFLLNSPGSNGVKAVIVYPMNALINSQTNELDGYKRNYEDATGRPFPISYGQYTGQEKHETRQRLRDNPPQILLTNYMMLELLLTRSAERKIRDAIYENLKYLVFDELHTYRGRQGADVAMLIRRIQAQCKNSLTFIGTSATMVSVGSEDTQREQVAEVATTIFGRQFEPNQIVNETLARSLESSNPDTGSLADSVETPIDSDADEAALRSHPVAVWIENNIALEETASGLSRRKPLQISQVVAALSAASGSTEGVSLECLRNILLWISKVNQKVQAEGSRYTLLPFKLHQFFAQTGSVYTTLDQGSDRYITLEPGLYKEDERPQKPIYPNVFSRESGHAFVCVSIVENRMIPREFKMTADEDLQANDGYLLVGDDIWDPETDLDYLPDAWFRTRANDKVPETKYADRFPQKIFFDEYGNCSRVNDKPYSGWFIKAPLLFDPTAGVFFDTRTNEGTKLTKLGSEGRSTSTTITTFSILNQLNDSGYSAKDQKLLSFTDNRQDAALQAGHFNDFVQVVKLRSAIYRALASAKDSKLDYTNIGVAISKSLNLEFTEYASAVESVFPHVRTRYEDTFQNFLFYRALADLRRSWRIVLPNLEQCGLVRVDYNHIDEVVNHEEAWREVPIVRSLTIEERRDFIVTILDFFRLEQAIHSENFLTRDRLGEFEKRFREQLIPPWSLDEKERLSEPYVVRLDTLQRNIKLYSKSIGPRSSVGKFIKQFVKHHPDLDPDEIRGDGYRRFMAALLETLESADYLVR